MKFFAWIILGIPITTFITLYITGWAYNWDIKKMTKKEERGMWKLDILLYVVWVAVVTIVS